MYTIGVDLIEVGRIESAIARWGERFLRRVYTPGEINYCAGRAQSLAARWAAKEAVIRGLSLPLPDGLRLEAFLSGTLRGTEDAAEGPRAFAEKRTPSFKAR